MKTNNFQFSIFNFQLIVILLLAVASCHSNVSPTLPASARSSGKIDSPLSSAPVDTLLYYAANGTVDQKMDAFFWLSFEYIMTNKRLSLQYANNLLRLAQKEKNKGWEGEAYAVMHGSYWHDHQFDSAIYCNEKAAVIFEDLKEDNKVILLKVGIAQCLKKLFKFDEALNIFLDCLDYIERKELSQYDRAGILQKIGGLYADMGIYDLSNDYYEQALNIFNILEKTSNVIRDMGSCYSGIGVNFEEMKEYEKAIEYQTKALEIFQQNNNVLFSGYSLNNLALCYFAIDKDEEAYKAISELGDIAKTLNNRYLLFATSNSKARYYYQQRQYKKSLEYAKGALLFVFDSDKGNLSSVYERLALASAHAGTSHETAGYIEKMNQLKKEAYDEERNNKVTEMEVKYETAKKELEIEQQRNIIASQNMQRSVLIAGIAVCALLLALLWYMLALRTRRNLALTERNEALVEMNATKSKFFSIISHDLKNPAVAQLDALRMLVNNTHLWDMDTLTDYCNQLMKSAGEHVELIFNLLGWAQVQTKRITFNPATIILSSFLPDISAVRKMAENKGVELIVDIPNDAIITGDSNILATVIRNLLTNAVKFTPSGGKVTLRAKAPLRDSPNPSEGGENSLPFGEGWGGALTISITDTGIGMSPEQVENLFHLDKTLSRQGTSGEQGSGLGLIVCKDLLAMHGSALYVESEEGKGSRFWFTV